VARIERLVAPKALSATAVACHHRSMPPTESQTESQIELRAPQEQDLTTLVDLCAAHAAYERASYQPRGKAERLAELLLSDNAPINCWLVERNGTTVGYVTFMKQFSTWDAAPYLYLDCLYLDEEVRGQGVGTVVMARLAHEAGRLGCRSAQWQTPEFNDGAIRFYQSLGAASLSKERFSWEFDTHDS
jgi:GNAT superfamily N-acetyltransferase